MVTFLARHADPLVIPERLETRANPRTLRQCLEQWLGEGVLTLHELACGRGFRVLQPTIWIGDTHTVIGVDHGAAFHGRVCKILG